MSAHDLAAAIVSVLPEHSLSDAVRWFGVDGNYDRDCGRCPRCGRALPLGSVGPAIVSMGMSGPIGIPHTAQELTAACLVDGDRATAAQDFPLVDFIDAAREVTSALHARGWKHWAKCMDRALAEPSNTERAEAVGQTLELIRRVGPSTLRAQPELEVMVTSLARYWPGQPE
jgi:hypothetical protein